jgi:hypothetical protein
MSVIAQLPRVVNPPLKMIYALICCRRWEEAKGKLLILVSWYPKFPTYLLLILVETDTEGTFRPERIQQIAERFGG